MTGSREAFARYTDASTFARIVEKGTVSEMWRDSVAAFSGQTAIIDGGTEYSYAALEADVARLRPLVDADAPLRVGVLAGNSYDFVRAFLAVTTLGHAAAVLPAQLDEEAILGCCLKYGLQKLVVQPELLAKTALLAEKRPDLPVISAAAQAGRSMPARDCAPADPCAIMFTGGTTGKSKGALLSNGAVLQGAVNGCYGYRDVFCQRYLLVLPLTHVFGLIRNLLTALYTGSALYICRNTQDMFRDIAAFRPTILVLVPALADMALTLSKKFGRNMLGPDLKYIICGAAAVAPYLITEYHKLGVTLLAGYGLTESANLVSGNPESLSRPESVGLPYPNQELRIEQGELWLKGKNMMDGYLGEDEPAFSDGWFRTGDLVRVDEDGFLYVTGRIKEIIVLPTGENVSPQEMEARFNALDCVQDCQVFEDYGDLGGRILALEVVPRAGALTGADAKEQLLSQLEQVNRALPSFQQVSRITLRDSDFARTPSMKIVRYQKCK